ncbi:NrfD protein [Moritella sp. JT01]|uniref:cytochrome c nitrite reductase subunit NrfD n=1 Tax=Moritella sp. JT01 TaxID=756698 RepID=UPI000793FBD4|nr:cytochrome c nitrite reductase subunit NrfD [Moritella sp. JT01]KXO09015.1 NrfD protein [Moritella sp. JT01]
MNTFVSAFTFDSLVWDWLIAIYLFLTGMSAGMVLISIHLKRKIIEGKASANGIIKATAILAPLGIITGLTILIFHLTKPLSFWKILVFFNPTSVMSMGVILFQVYMIVLFTWIAIMFKDELAVLLQTLFKGRFDFVNPIVDKLAKFENALELLLALLAMMLAAYTGFLLSALKTYPMLNNPVLPVLFIFSSVSSGAAACLLLGIVGFKESFDSNCVKWIHGIERPVVVFELFVLLTFFTGLIFGGGQKEVAAMAAIGSGFWASWFWYGVVGAGMLMPLALNFFVPAQSRHNKVFVLLVTSLSLAGVLMLRTFILYAGQMTVV